MSHQVALREPRIVPRLVNLSGRHHISGAPVSTPNNLLCLILSGGQGRRLWPATAIIQKTLLPATGGRRLIDLALQFCRCYQGDLASQRTIVLANLNASQVKAHVRRYPAASVSVDHYLTGPAGAILQAWDSISVIRAAHLAVVPGDHAIPGNIGRLFDLHVSSDRDLTVAAVRSDAKEHDYLVTDSAMRVRRFSKYNERITNLAYTGIAIVKTQTLQQYLESTPSDQVHDLLPMYSTIMANQAGAFGLLDNMGWSDLGTWPRYSRYLWACLRPRGDAARGTKGRATLVLD